MTVRLFTGMGHELAAWVDSLDTPLEVTELAICRAIGDELRRIREERGWSREHLASLLPSKITERTLASYEHGTRQMTFARLVEICGALDVNVGAAATHALQRAGLHLDKLAIRLDLRALLRDSGDTFEPIARWARNSLDLYPHGLVELDAVTVRHLASCMGCEHGALARYLARFIPEQDGHQKGRGGKWQLGKPPTA